MFARFKFFISGFLFALAIFFCVSPQVMAVGLGDLNGDNKVNIFDYNAFLPDFGKTGNPGFTSADLNSDGKINVFDYNLLVTNFGKSYAITPTNATNKIQIGAIFFNGSHSTNRNEIEQLLAFPQWKHAWPYYTIVRSPSTIDIHEADQRIIDQEIQLAAAGGLDYWAFLGDPIASSNYGFKYYSTSPYKNQLKFAFILQAEWLADPTVQANNFDRIVKHLKDSQYVMVTPQQRPLVYIFQPESLVEAAGSEAAAKTQLQKFSQAVTASLGKPPVLVAMSNLPPATLKNLLFEAKSFYFLGSGGKGAPYSSLANNTVNAWNKALTEHSALGLGVLPTAMTGFDPRPKALNPLLHGFGTTPNWNQQGTPTEIAAHILQAKTWVQDHPNNTPAKAVLIYAWNEFAEGGWLTAMKEGDNQRLNALSKVLGGTIKGPPASPYSPPPAPHPIGTVTITSPIEGSTIPANKPIVIAGKSPMAARLNFALHTSKLFLINGKGDSPSRSFSVELPALSAGGPYTLTVTGEDTQTVTIKNLRVK